MERISKNEIIAMVVVLALIVIIALGRFITSQTARLIAPSWVVTPSFDEMPNAKYRLPVWCDAERVNNDRKNLKPSTVLRGDGKSLCVIHDVNMSVAKDEGGLYLFGSDQAICDFIVAEAEIINNRRKGIVAPDPVFPLYHMNVELVPYKNYMPRAGHKH